MGRRGRCHYNGCNTEKRYVIGFHEEGEDLMTLKPVCGTHDRLIGRKNLMSRGWTLEEAIKFERNPDLIVLPNKRLPHQPSLRIGQSSALLEYR